MKLKHKKMTSLLLAFIMLFAVLPFSNIVDANRENVIEAVTDEEGYTTFAYQGDETTERVTLAASFNGWNTENLVLEEKENKLFSYTHTEKLGPGDYEYKFLINGEWIEGENFTFTIEGELPEEENEFEEKRLVIHFDNPGGEDDWNIWGWSADPDKEGGQYNFLYEDNYGSYLEISFSGNTKKAGFILKQGDGWDKKDIDHDRFVDLNTEETHIWLKQGVEEVFMENPNPEDITGQTKIIFHFDNPTEKIWDLHVWEEGEDGKDYEFTRKDAFGHVAEILLEGEHTKVGFLVKDDDWNKNISDDRFVEITNNPQHVYIRDKDPNVYYTRPIKLEDENVRFTSLTIDGFRELTLNLSRLYDVNYLIENNELLINGTISNDKIESITAANGNLTRTNQLIIKLNEDLELDSKVVFQGKTSEEAEIQTIEARIGNLIASKEFDEKYSYDGDLGPIYASGSTEFKVWAPTSQNVDLLIFNGDDIVETIPMERNDRGVYSTTLTGDQLGTVYMYDVHFADKTNRSVDPYAKAVTVNGQKSVVANPQPQGMPRPINSDILNPIIYELHVRDLSSQDISGITDKGTFNGLVEEGTKTPTGQITGFDYIKSLGITHVQLLPIYDYRTVDETNPQSSFNWGYDPLNFNSVEGSYSTNPYDPFKRISELQNAIDKFHRAGLGVIMDVVYNHVFDPRGHAFEHIVPGYYFRQDSNGNFLGGTGVGNETASERTMVQRYIIDSITYWTKTFNLDGFRFDLMGTHDIETMNKIRTELEAINPNIFILGEGWNMDMGIPEKIRATQINADKLPGIAFFNDDLRDGIRGSVFVHEDKGFATGKPTNEAYIMQNIKGAQGLKSYTSAAQIIQYVEAHDNLTLWDKIKATNPGEDDATSLQRHKLATTMTMLSQGTPFIHAGQEFARTKNGDDNSYKSPDSVNQFDWNRVEEMANNVDYFRELVKIRKAYNVFNLKDYGQINNVFNEIKQSEGVVAYSLQQDADTRIYIAHNGTQEVKEFDLPNGNYRVLIKDQEANLEGLSDLEIIDGKVQISGLSSLVLLADSKDLDEADKTELRELVSTVRSIEDIYIYTNESGEALRRALGNAQQVLDDVNATQEEVDNAKMALQEAYDNLEEIVLRIEKTKVDKTIEEVNPELKTLVDSIYNSYKYLVYDIQVLDQNDKVYTELESPMTVNIRQTELGFTSEQFASLKIYNNHKDSQGTLELIEVPFEIKEGSVVFESDKFSDFVFVVQIADPHNVDFGLEIRDLDDKRTDEITIVLKDSEGNIIEGSFNQYKQWMTDNLVPGKYIVELTGLPENTKAVINETVATQIGIATDTPNTFEFTILGDEEGRQFIALILEKLEEEPVDPKDPDPSNPQEPGDEDSKPDPDPQNGKGNGKITETTEWIKSPQTGDEGILWAVGIFAIAAIGYFIISRRNRR